MVDSLAPLSSTRDAIASADAVIGRVRSQIASRVRGSAHANALLDEELRADQEREAVASAMRIADEWERHALTIVHEAKLAEASANFRERWPAMVRWRDRVLANPRRQKPSMVAAAYESLALECTLAGEHHLAAKAQQAAMNALSAGRAIAPRTPDGEPEALSA